MGNVRANRGAAGARTITDLACAAFSFGMAALLGRSFYNLFWGAWSIKHLPANYFARPAGRYGLFWSLCS